MELDNRPPTPDRNDTIRPWRITIVGSILAMAVGTITTAALLGLGLETAQAVPGGIAAPAVAAATIRAVLDVHRFAAEQGAKD